MQMKNVPNKWNQNYNNKNVKKNTMAWWFLKKVGQPILIVDAETEPMASSIVFNSILWYRFCGWKQCIFHLLQCGAPVMQ